jgi:hypothetical protein
MGALRAAELAPFGMIGVGRVFEGYLSGALVDDDEVAVAHGPPDLGYRTQSDALVDIRATLESAVAAQILAPAEASSLLERMRAIFYAERRNGLLPSLAEEAGMAANRVEALKRWLTTAPAVSQKHTDGLAMLQRVADDLRGRAPATTPSFVFRNTDAWRQFRRQMDGERERDGHTDARGQQPVEPQPPNAWFRALERAFALALADAEGHRPTVTELQEYSEAFRKSNGLFDPTDTQKWLDVNHMSLEDFSRFIYEELVFWRFRSRTHALAREQMESLAPATGRFGTSALS